MSLVMKLSHTISHRIVTRYLHIPHFHIKDIPRTAYLLPCGVLYGDYVISVSNKAYFRVDIVSVEYLKTQGSVFKLKLLLV